MANVNPDTLVNNKTNESRRWTTALGPMKIEWIFVAPDSGDQVTNGNTQLTTRLAHPLYATATASTDLAGNTAISGTVNNTENNANFKQITLHDTNVNGLSFVVMVIGF